MARRVGVSMPALHNFEQGFNISEPSEQKIIDWIEATI